MSLPVLQGSYVSAHLAAMTVMVLLPAEVIYDMGFYGARVEISREVLRRVLEQPCHISNSLTLL